jgi:hypothetical protein
MSDVEDATRALNAQVVEGRKDVATEHMAALNRERLASEACYDPRIIAFKARRQVIAGQIRWWKPSVDQALPKKRFK